MSNAELLIKEIKTLPNDYVDDVLDFVTLLKRKAAREQTEPEAEECPVCAKHRDPVTGDLRFNAETMAGMQEVEDMISGKIPVKWHKSLEDLDKILGL